MTLEPYNAEKLDRLALRLMDISAGFRRISQIAAELPDVPLACTNRKAREVGWPVGAMGGGMRVRLSWRRWCRRGLEMHKILSKIVSRNRPNRPGR